MKKVFNKISIAALAASLVLSGCSKSYLDKSPADSLTASDALNTVAGLQDALRGVYSGLRSYNLFGRDFPVIGDLMADNTFVETKNSGRYLTQYNYSVVSSDGVATEMWTNAYTVIQRCNRIIAATPTGADADAVKAQAQAVRALLYFKLVNIYAKPYSDDPSALGVPLITVYDPFNYPMRSSVKDVYTQIVTDLTGAFTKAPAYESSATISKYFVEALLSKVYLYMGDNANALTSASDVITNSGFKLLTAAGYDAYWASPSDRTDQLETLFEVDADVINNNGFDDLGGIYINGYQDIYASSQLVALYNSTDVRKDVLKPGTTKSGATATLVTKYPNATSADRDNIKVMRLSEVYLIAAEAAAATNSATGLNYLNTLVSKRDASLTYSSTGAQLTTDILTERRKELAFEGDRYYDLQRKKMDVVRVANNGAIAAGTNNVNLTVPYSSPKRIYPIPQTEINANPNIASQQNPGY